MSIPAIERHYRVITIIERLQQLEAELGVLAESTYGAERYRIERAMWHIIQSADLLKGQAPATERDMIAVLRASIALVREQKSSEEGA